MPKELELSHLPLWFTSKKKGAHEVVVCYQQITRRTLMHPKGLVARKDYDSD